MSHYDTLKVYKIYKETDEEILRKKQAKCKHPKWTKKCSCCSMVLDNEKLNEKKRGKEIII